MKRRFAALALTACLLAAAAPGAAAAPYRGYTYDQKGSEQAAPVLYAPQKEADGEKLTGLAMAGPSDLCIFENELYILDAGNSRLVIADPELSAAREQSFTDQTGRPMRLEQALGLYVCGRGIYVSDAGSLKVYRFDAQGRLLQIFAQPDSPLYDRSIPFKVTRMLADSAGNLYALVEGQYSGAVMFSALGEFLGFYGPNEVEMTLDMLLDQSWKQILSEEQQNAMSRFIPVAYTSFDIDSENFIYTCSQNAISQYTRVRRLNPSGKGLWDGRELLFGDDIPEEQWVPGLANTTQAADLDISGTGYLNVLDAARGRVFQYDANGVLLGVFGGKGQQLGTFQDPAAIESLGEAVYVLDRKNAAVTRFVCTEYGAALQNAMDLYNQGEYERAQPYWEQVLAMDGSSRLACLGMGKAMYAQGFTGDALRYLKASQDKEQYSQVFESYRLEFVRGHFTQLAAGAALALAALWMLARRRWFGLGRRMEPFARHLRVMTHPVEGVRILKEKGQLSARFAAVTVGGWLVLEIVAWFGTGFVFNSRDPDGFNLLFPVVGTVLAYGLWVLVNWAVSTLADGKGTAKELFCASAYALLPYLFGKATVLILSHLLTLQEGAFLVWIETAAFGWSVLILCSVLMTLHHYTLGKVCGSIALTLAGIVVVLFLLFMAVVLFEHVSNLFMIVYNELTLRR